MFIDFCVALLLAWENQKVKHRADDYKQLKESFGFAMWDQALRVFPQLDGKVIL